MEYKLEELTEAEAGYIGEKINEIVPRETDADEEEFVLKVENENGEIIGGCIAEAYEYHWSRLLLEDLWVNENYRHQGIGSMLIREAERVAREKGCRVVTLGTASYMARPFYEKHGYAVFTAMKAVNGYIDYSLVKYLEKDAPEYVPAHNRGAKYKVSFGNDDDAQVILNGIRAYSEAYEEKCERIEFCRKLVAKDGRFAAGLIANVNKGYEGFVSALFVEEPLRRQGLGTYLLREVEKLTRQNGAPVVLTSAGDWNVGFFKKNGYLVRGELKDVPKGHDCYELYKEI
ncbi:MAG: GNAT family N-acetyltransferase [Clostridiales bacterium]|nr:GNAT family N-acetyltransferase [Clostridiales bacterium]